MNSISQQDLKAACSELHERAEKTRFAQELINGTTDPLIYKNHCYQLYLIVDMIESQIPMIDDLYRRHALVKDIASGPGMEVKACPATLEYVSYLSRQLDPQRNGQFNGHIYTHYLGWLYGGQMIAKKLRFLPKRHLEFNKPKECVDFVRNIFLKDLYERDAEEAKKAFEYSIRIYEELYELY
jgi:heme oxygenase